MLLQSAKGRPTDGATGSFGRIEQRMKKELLGAFPGAPLDRVSLARFEGETTRAPRAVGGLEPESEPCSSSRASPRSQPAHSRAVPKPGDSSEGAVGGALEVRFPVAYSAFDGKHKFQVPATVAVAGVKGIKWSASDPAMVDLEPNSNGSDVLITTKKAGTVDIIAKSGNLTGSSRLTMTAFPAEMWEEPRAASHCIEGHRSRRRKARARLGRLDENERQQVGRSQPKRRESAVTLTRGAFRKARKSSIDVARHASCWRGRMQSNSLRLAALTGALSTLITVVACSGGSVLAWCSTHVMDVVPRLVRCGPSTRETAWSRICDRLRMGVSKRVAGAAIACAIVVGTPARADDSNDAAPPPAEPPRAATPATDEPAKNAVFVELLGNGLTYSVNYERAFLEHLRVRVGLGVLPWGSASKGHIVTVPLVASYLIGNDSSSLELGLGGTFCSVTGTFTYDGGPNKPCGILLTGVVGYRYAPREGGFVFRIGLTPLIFVRSDPLFRPWPGMSFGASF